MAEEFGQHRSVDTAPLYEAIRASRFPMAPSYRTVSRLWRNLAERYPKQVHIHEWRVSKNAPPVEMAVVAEDARDPELLGGHVSLNGIHACEQVPTLGSFATGSFIRSRLHQAPELVFRAVLSADRQGAELNSYLGKKLDVQPMLDGRHRALGLGHNVDFDMPQLFGAYKPSRLESVAVSEILMRWVPGSVLSPHQFSYSPFGYMQCNEPYQYSPRTGKVSLKGGDYGYVRSVSQVVRRYARPAPFSVDEPNLPSLAPGVFGRTPLRQPTMAQQSSVHRWRNS